MSNARLVECLIRAGTDRLHRVLPVLKEQLSKQAIRLKGVINTHHHGDHAGGNKALVSNPMSFHHGFERSLCLLLGFN